MIQILKAPSKRFLWRLYLLYALVIIVSFLSLSLYSTHVMRKRFLAQAETDLLEMSRMVEESLRPSFEGDPAELERRVIALGQQGGIRITIINRDGSVLADSEHSPEKMDNHIGRPEVQAALSGAPSHATRYSTTLHKDMMYVAYPVPGKDGVLHIVRVSKPRAELFELIASQNNTFMLITMIMACSAVLFSYVAYRRMTSPLRKLKTAAQKFARGEFSIRLSSGESDDMQELFDAMNQMAEQLDSRIKTVMQQSYEQDAMFESMVEGVLAVSNSERILKANAAMIEFLEGKISDFYGRSLVEVVRSLELQHFIRQALGAASSVDEELTLVGVKERRVRVSARPLLDGEGETMGTFVVVHDVTKLRRLENIRRDFVANVSHELRTPITSIKGSVDTLIEGAADDPATNRKFLEIIARQSERLVKIVDDLLGLARIEASKVPQAIQFEPVNLASVVEASISLCEQKASTKRIAIQTSGLEKGPMYTGNEILLEQALVNLLTNAIDYSEDGGTILVGLEDAPCAYTLSVQDFGCGIAVEHQPRLFERFYRVDRARSRKLGGTGLGLSIVKHIAQVHGGSASVESVLGEGSTFSMHLPRTC